MVNSENIIPIINIFYNITIVASIIIFFICISVLKTGIKKHLEIRKQFMSINNKNSSVLFNSFEFSKKQRRIKKNKKIREIKKEFIVESCTLNG